MIPQQRTPWNPPIWTPLALMLAIVLAAALLRMLGR